MTEQNARQQVLAALEHPEAEEGLYFDNFYHLHEEDERPVVTAPQVDVLEALKLLIEEGVVVVNDESENAVIFRLAQ
jgi:hypothetical protein